LLAVLDADEREHTRADRAWSRLVPEEDLVSTNYVLLETFALVQNRLGLRAANTLQQDVVPEIRLFWVNQEIHDASVAALLTSARRRLSLVDCSSFEAMRRLGIKTAFAFDRHFAEQGFEVVP
jgi:predicted nucleic acid-binding protein